MRLTIYEIVKVKMPKLTMMPRVIPRGFFFPPVVLDERMIGSSGQMHGAKIVTNPDKNAKTNRIPIILL